jgi:hypothetical protein
MFKQTIFVFIMWERLIISLHSTISCTLPAHLPFEAKSNKRKPVSIFLLSKCSLLVRPILFSSTNSLRKTGVSGYLQDISHTHTVRFQKYVFSISKSHFMLPYFSLEEVDKGMPGWKFWVLLNYNFLFF